MEFIIGDNNYNYGLFYEEGNSKYYITDKTIDLIINEIRWNKNNLEEEYLKSWRTFERIHRQYCLEELNLEGYESAINEEYIYFERRTSYEFGENVDELINHIIRCLESSSQKS